MVSKDEINYKKEIKKCFDDMKSIKTFYKQIPNLLTVSRALFGPFVSVMFLMGYPIVGVIFTAVLCFTDMIDGKLARKWNVVSKFGADLDAFCDKIMFLGLSIPLLVGNPIILLNFVLEGIISLINVIGRINGLDTQTVFSGKVKTWFLLIMLGVGYLVQYLNVSVNFLNIMSVLTFISQGISIIDYIKEYHILNDEKKKNSNNVKEIEQIEYVKSEEVEVKKNVIDELKQEREFLLDTKNITEVDRTYVRKRKYDEKNTNNC